jgi:hypothetical protein
VNLTGANGAPLDAVAAAALLRERGPHPALAAHEKLPDDTRLWAALQRASGGAWSGVRLRRRLGSSPRSMPGPRRSPRGPRRRCAGHQDREDEGLITTKAHAQTQRPRSSARQAGARTAAPARTKRHETLSNRNGTSVEHNGNSCRSQRMGCVDQSRPSCRLASRPRHCEDPSTAASPQTRLLAPIGSQEVWAAGVTYFRSRTARMEESQEAGGGSFYDKV